MNYSFFSVLPGLSPPRGLPGAPPARASPPAEAGAAVEDLASALGAFAWAPGSPFASPSAAGAASFPTTSGSAGVAAAAGANATGLLAGALAGGIIADAVGLSATLVIGGAVLLATIPLAPRASVIQNETKS